MRMNRALVALLSAFDALVQAAVGLAVVAATLVLLWAFGADPAWHALWPATGTIWQLGQLVPLEITLPEDLMVLLGAPDAAAHFTFSLAPLVLTLFTAVFGLRSGARAARAGAWGTAALAAVVIAAAVAAAIALTTSNDVAGVHLAAAVGIPAALYGVAVLLGGVVTAWRIGDDGVIDRMRAHIEAFPGAWPAVLRAGVRGGVAALAGVVGVGAVTATVALFTGAGDVVALFQAGNADPAGVVVLMIAQAAYLPTVIVWAMSWVVGPGFAVGAGTSVSPAATDVGVLPGIPLLGAIPELESTWLLLVVLVPVAAGALAGAIARESLFRERLAPRGPAHSSEAFLPRLAVSGLVALLAAGGAAALAALASGSIGPGSLADVGPHPGPVALAVGVEVLVGASILLLSPQPRR